MTATSFKRQALLSVLALSLLGSGVQVSAQSADINPAVIFAKSVPAGPPYRALYSGDRESLVKALLADKLFEVMEGNYGPNADADGFYSEKMNCTVLLSRSGKLWVTAQKGQPSSDLHYQAVLMDSK